MSSNKLLNLENAEIGTMLEDIKGVLRKWSVTLQRIAADE